MSAEHPTTPRPTPGGASEWKRPVETVRSDVAALLQLATEDHLPLSVRHTAAQAATTIVEAWFACKTYDEWSARA